MHTISIFSSVERVLSAFGVWGWLDLAGAGFVVIGCVGEFWILLNKAPSHTEKPQQLKGIWWALDRFVAKARSLCVWLGIIRLPKMSKIKEDLLEAFFLLMVAVGVGMELVDLPVSLLEVAQISKEAGAANERARNLEISNAWVWQTNLVLQNNFELLRAKNDELELKMRPRRINMEQRTNFVMLTENIPKIPIKILIGQEGRDTEDLANDLRETLTMAGFKMNPDAGPWGINRDSTLLVSPHLENTNDCDLLFFSHLTNSASAKITTWVLTSTATTLDLDVLQGPGHAGPAHLIIGPPGGPTYANANGSIAGNGPHNPFLNQVASFTLTVPNMTAADTIDFVSFSFGTMEGANIVAGVSVPEGGMTVVLFGMALSGLGLIRRKLR